MTLSTWPQGIQRIPESISGIKQPTDHLMNTVSPDALSRVSGNQALAIPVQETTIWVESILQVGFPDTKVIKSWDALENDARIAA